MHALSNERYRAASQAIICPNHREKQLLQKMNKVPDHWLLVNLPGATSKVFNEEHLAIEAAPGTDIYTSPLGSEQHVYTAPAYQACIPLAAFKLARLTFSFTPTLQFDQGGLLFTLPSKINPIPNKGNASEKSKHPAWIKIGIEVNEGQPWVSVCSRPRDGWVDWSLSSLEAKNDVGLGREVSATIELMRYKNALMIYRIQGDEKMLIRKIPWVFLPDDETSGEILVGAYAARPDPENLANGHPLAFKGSDLVVELS